MDIMCVRSVFHRFKFGEAITNLGDGRDDKRRERIRGKAALGFPDVIPDHPDVKWGFRIHAKKSGRRRFDIDNIPKLIIDAFNGPKITGDHSVYPYLRLYADDTIDTVIYLECTAERVSAGQDSTAVTILLMKE